MSTASAVVPVGYKQTEVGVIPEDWSVKQLGSLLSASPKYGINAPAVAFDLNLPTYIRITDISPDGYFIHDNKKSVIYPFSNLYQLSEGNIVFARTGASVGKSYMYNPKDGELVFAGFLIKVEPNIRLLYPNYLKFIVQTQTYWSWILENSMRSGQPGINGKQYATLPIPLPPTITEQEYIGDTINDCEILIESLQELVAKRKYLKQGTMQKLLSRSKHWQPTAIGDIASNKKWSLTGGPFGSNLQSRDHTNSGVRIIQLQNIGDGEFINKHSTFTSEAKADNLLPNNIFSGEIILSKMGDPVARGCLVPGVDERFVMCSDGIRLSVNVEKFDTNFVLLMINHNDFRKAAENASTGSTRKRIGLTELRTLKINCPKFSEQKTISSIIVNMNAEITALEKRLEKAKAIKQGMMQQLLTGKIRLVEPQTSQEVSA